MTIKKGKSGGLSRRDFLKDAGLLAGGAAIGSTVLLAACAGEPETTTITKTETAPGATVTSTAPGATVTSTAPGATVTSTAPGATVTSTAPGATVTSTAPGTTTTVTKTMTTTAQAGELITIMNPEGQRDPIVYQQLAPRLNTLEGKTIYLVDVNFTATWQFLEELEKYIKEKIPSATVVRKIKAGSYAASDIPLWDEVEANADAWIMATGH